MRNPIIPCPESAPFLTQDYELGQEIQKGNLEYLLSKNKDEATDIWLHLLFLLLLFYWTIQDGQNYIDEQGPFMVSHMDGAEQFSTTIIELLSSQSCSLF